uniref:Uncharacterized protein n=1 Tax=Esox lucius TaxID=8010 RepID=A0A6Q2WUU9_ESOLU
DHKAAATNRLCLFCGSGVQRAGPFDYIKEGDSMDDNIETQTFLYFAYGSNLLKERLQIKNPSAYKLVFGNYKGLASERWHGGVATIENSPDDEVWGVVWRMNVSDLESLDSQENVRLGAYRPVEVKVKTMGKELNCRTYIMNNLTVKYLLFLSFGCPKVIVMGAEQNGLPKDYQEKLKAIETNKYEGPLPVMAELERIMKKADS